MMIKAITISGEGGTYEVKASLLGFETSFNVNIIETPVESVEIQDVDLIVGENTYWAEDYDDDTDEYLSYKKYDYQNRLSYTITLKNGEVIEDYGSYFEYDGCEYSVYCTDDQSYYNQWDIGTHVAEISLLGYKTTFNVNITEGFVKSIDIDDFEIIEKTNGSWRKNNFDKEISWYYYDYFYDIKYTVTLEDGSVIKDSGDWFEYANEIYYISVYDDQGAYNPWEIGNHKVTASLMNVETEFNVNIVETPVKSVELEPVSIINGTNCSKEYGWDYDTDEEYSWINYDYSSLIEYKITLKDGSVINGSSRSIVYNKEYYVIECLDDQGVNNEWGIGNHSVKVYLLGYEADLTISIIEAPIKSIETEDVNIMEYTYSHIDYGGDYGDDDSSWRYYDWEDLVSFKVTFNDGTVSYSQRDGSVEYQGETYYFDTYDEQSYENQWKLGKNTGKICFMGVEADVTVNITEFIYKDLKVDKVTYIDDLNYDKDFIYSTEHFDKFGVRFTLTDKNGKTYSDVCNLRAFESGMDIKFENEHMVQGENKFTISFGPLSAEGCLMVSRKPTYSYIEQNGGLYITDICVDASDIMIPATIDSKPVIGFMSLGNANYNAVSLKLPDSIKFIGENAIKTCYALETIEIGSNVEYLDADMFAGCDSLKKINISSENKSYKSINGVLYNKEGTTLVAYPLGKGKNYNVPASVENIDVLDSWQYCDLNVTFDDNSKSYKTVDDVTYSADMTKVIRCNKKKSGAYTMPESVNKISEKAFSNCNAITEVSISKNVTDIVYGAFEDCAALKKVTMPSSVKKISEYAFQFCYKLTDVSFSEKLEEIGYRAFMDTNIETLTLPNTVKSIGNEAFCSCEKLKAASFGNNLKVIGEGAFESCSLNKLVLPETLEKIGDRAFLYGGEFTELVIPDSVKELGERSFGQCDKLQSVTLGKGLTQLEPNTFTGCDIQNLVIPANIKNIKNLAVIGLNSISFADGIESIGANAVDENAASNIDSKIAPKYMELNYEAMSGTPVNTVTKLVYMFGSLGNDSLKEVNIPDSVRKISAYAFEGTQWDDNLPTGDVYLNRIYFKYKGNMPQNTSVSIKNGTKVIADFAFQNQTNLKKVSLPEGIERIGSMAFNGCDALTTIDIPASVNDIGVFAFTNCHLLTAVNVSADNKYYSSDNGVLYNKDKTELIYCPKQKSSEFTVPDSVKKIRAFAFDADCVDKVIINNPNIELENFAIGADLAKLLMYEKTVPIARALNTVISCPAGSTAQKYADRFLVKTDIAEELIIGDPDGDGVVSIMDSTAIQKCVAQLSDMTEAQKAAADVDHDGVVSVLDSTQIQKFVAQLIDTL